MAVQDEAWTPPTAIVTSVPFVSELGNTFSRWLILNREPLQLHSYFSAFFQKTFYFNKLGLLSPFPVVPVQTGRFFFNDANLIQ